MARRRASRSEDDGLVGSILDLALVSPIVGLAVALVLFGLSIVLGVNPEWFYGASRLLAVVVFLFSCMVSITAFIGFIRGGNRYKSAPSDRQTPRTIAPWTKRQLLSDGERAFYEVLRRAVGHNCVIFAKVRLSDLVILPVGTPGWQGLFNSASQKHIDFVLCDPRTVTPFLLIELDDKTHMTDKAVKRDTFVNEVCRTAGLLLHRQRCLAAYDVGELRRVIDRATANSPC